MDAALGLDTFVMRRGARVNTAAEKYTRTRLG